MRCTALVLSVCLLIPTLAAADAVEEVRQAEIAFAKAFADRDQAKFFSMVADDATFLSFGALRGKQKVIERWSRFFQSPEAPFSWGPERVEVTADGTLGLSIGPIYDPQGNHAGDYASVWRKQSDGSWKVAFDGPGAPSAPLPERAAKIEEGFVTADDGTKLFYRKIGQSPLTVIVPYDVVMFEPFKQFSDIATIITYDMRSRGRSAKAQDPSSTTIQNDVKDLEAVRRHFKVEKFVPVGFSYLGKMVAMYAAAYPQHVSRVIQLGPMANNVENASTQRQVAVDDIGAPAEVKKRWDDTRASGGIEKTPREACEAMYGFLSYVLVGKPKNASRVEIKNTCSLENEWPVNFNRTIAVLWGSAQTPMTAEELKKISMPVLTIHGTKDRNAPFDGGLQWVGALPDARLVRVEGAAHALWIDDPVVVFGSIKHFLRGEWPLGSEKP